MKLNRRVKRIFLEHKSSYIGMILLIIISTSCFLGFKTATLSVTKNVKDNRISHHLEDANFTLAIPLSDTDVKKYEKNYSVKLQENQYIELENGYNKAVLKIIPEAQKINTPKLYDGSYLKNQNDILVDRYFFQAQNLKFGDKINLYDNEYTVCGTFTTPNYLSLTRLDTDFMADGSKFGVIVMNDLDFKKLSDNNIKINYSVILKNNNVEEFRRELSKNNFVTNWTSKETNNRITTFDGENSAMVTLSIVAFIFINNKHYNTFSSFI